MEGEVGKKERGLGREEKGPSLFSFGLFSDVKGSKTRKIRMGVDKAYIYKIFPFRKTSATRNDNLQVSLISDTPKTST